MLRDSLQLTGFRPVRVTPAMIHNSALQVEEPSPHDIPPQRHCTAALRRSVRGAPFGLWGIRMLEAAGHGRGCSELLASSGDNSAAAIGKALAAPVARLSGDANGCLHYPPADA
ncbi:hypothetical protein TASIC1_0003061000 [Trichoderma asperellum]|uniref:Uncharacterized protein n=1 Tax=Trichoderma asperellum TaxID=101201 RepID=A0A6V8QPZ2_TRIAP|nr:hypothetical protein TASIC1_0003061000 [Trichoderma asperellum]